MATTSEDYKPSSDAAKFASESLDYTGDNVWNAIYTVQLGELIENGVFDWSSTLLDWSAAQFDDDQYKRVCEYFTQRFYFREISIEPYYEWAQRLHYKLVFELMPKYKPLYQAVADGIDPLQVGEDYEKRRTIGSEYPETLLSGNSDYISTGTDLEYDHVQDGDPLERLTEWAEKYRSIDQMLLDELEVFFVGLYTVSANVL